MDVHKTSTKCIVATMSNTLLIWANTYMQMCERLGETNIWKWKLIATKCVTDSSWLVSTPVVSYTICIYTYSCIIYVYIHIVVASIVAQLKNKCRRHFRLAWLAEGTSASRGWRKKRCMKAPPEHFACGSATGERVHAMVWTRDRVASRCNHILLRNICIKTRTSNLIWVYVCLKIWVHTYVQMYERLG